MLLMNGILTVFARRQLNMTTILLIGYLSSSLGSNELDLWELNFLFALIRLMRLWLFSSSVNSLSWHVKPSSGIRCLIFGWSLRLLSYFTCANSEGSGETAHMRRLAWAFAGRLCDKYHNLMSWRHLYVFVRENGGWEMGPVISWLVSWLV